MDFLERLTIKIIRLKIFERGIQNARDLEVNPIEISFEDLPRNFDGYRIMHLSDLHIDGQEGLTEIVVDRCKGIEADVTLLTGDYQHRCKKDSKEAIKCLRRVVPELRRRDGIFAVRGNNDPNELVTYLETLGVQFLHDSVQPVHREGEAVWLIGLDDRSRHSPPDFESIFKPVPERSFKILMVHRPDFAFKAAAQGVNLYLCGHTHGGQIHIPPLGPIFLNSRVPRRFALGLWRKGNMWGYTTRGVGSGFVNLRYGCRPEIAIITLRRQEDMLRKDRPHHDDFLRG